MPLEDYRQLVVGQQTSNFSRSQARFFLTCCLGNRIQTCTRFYFCDKDQLFVR